MSRPCTVCQHPERRDVNRALVKGGESERTIARRFGLTQAAIDRHRRNHLRPHLSELISEDPELAELDPLAEIRSLYYRVKRVLSLAEDARDWPTLRAFYGEARKDLALMAKIVGELNVQYQDEFYIAPRVHSAILAALWDYPEAGRAVADALGEVEEEANVR